MSASIVALPSIHDFSNVRLSKVWFLQKLYLRFKHNTSSLPLTLQMSVVEYEIQFPFIPPHTDTRRWRHCCPAAETENLPSAGLAESDYVQVKGCHRDRVHQPFHFLLNRKFHLFIFFCISRSVLDRSRLWVIQKTSHPSGTFVFVSTLLWLGFSMFCVMMFSWSKLEKYIRWCMVFESERQS